MKDFRQYEQLQKKTDLFFEKVSSQHFEKIQCRKGCYQCCKANLNISIIEKEYIEQTISKDLELLSKIKKNVERKNKDTKYCSFLGEQGECLIYNARPLICRSHGIPIQVKESDTIKRDVCELNFIDIDLNQLETDHILNIDTLNTILSVLNMQMYKEKSDERYELDPSSILS